MEQHKAWVWLTNEEQSFGTESNTLQLTIAELRWALFRLHQGREGTLFPVEGKEDAVAFAKKTYPSNGSGETNWYVSPLNPVPKRR